MRQVTELLTADEIAERLGVRPRTVREWSRKKLIPAVRLSRKVIRYDPTAVVAALTERWKCWWVRFTVRAGIRGGRGLKPAALPGMISR